MFHCCGAAGQRRPALEADDHDAWLPQAHARAASGKVVDIKDISDSDYAPAQLWEFVKGENQDWVVTEVEKEAKAPVKRAVKEVKAEKPVKAPAKAAKLRKTAKKRNKLLRA